MKGEAIFCFPEIGKRSEETDQGFLGTSGFVEAGALTGATGAGVEVAVAGAEAAGVEAGAGVAGTTAAGVSACINWFLMADSVGARCA